MSRRPAPTRGGAGRPPPPVWPPDLPGLVVDLGEYGGRWPDGFWSRVPAAVWRCRHGCTRHATGPAAITQLLTDLDAAPERLHDLACHPPRTT